MGEAQTASGANTRLRACVWPGRPSACNSFGIDARVGRLTRQASGGNAGAQIREPMDD